MQKLRDYAQQWFDGLISEKEFRDAVVLYMFDKMNDADWQSLAELLVKEKVSG